MEDDSFVDSLPVKMECSGFDDGLRAVGAVNMCEDLQSNGCATANETLPVTNVFVSVVPEPSLSAIPPSVVSSEDQSMVVDGFRFGHPSGRNGTASGSTSSLSPRASEHSYKCNICRRKFWCSRHFKLHKELQPCERLHKCDACWCKFRKVFHLKTHKAIHTKRFPKCSASSESFCNHRKLTTIHQKIICRKAKMKQNIPDYGEVKAPAQPTVDLPSDSNSLYSRSSGYQSKYQDFITCLDSNFWHSRIFDFQRKFQNFVQGWDHNARFLQADYFSAEETLSTADFSSTEIIKETGKSGLVFVYCG